ncbi:ribonucleoside-triphosphate reductase activating protein [Clostridium novyi B str. ATCC 27606]|uniref:Anaerobic ribonucleoside-triphosphate reductase-activating protein n=2 Tax=Clostridium TaxID=1485 RepID=A0AA40M6C9_CLONO|nr:MULTISPECIES: anaerobic ribonucleoside-triphosphate reductase activating protein [Clostridium]KEI12318.1 ribonucleoside-triphosphate reductase activating protein [Clostridium novyi B str. NCTC 9691]KEI17450.1 ribonucleoside-triphosphate reductase activating protein [Clostridium haemolyticum NCTC 9693]KEI18404.1 ribonucleoside-triphosphate reductase activating protein [Clostridium novyi B str. ATCC 27606]KGN04300.1 ribonucleoside-triphosphate reductase activating protein [Clostridium haemolyt
MKLRVAGFLDNTMVNGKGIRSTLFLSGCHHNCNECQNKHMQDFHYGEDIDIKDILSRIESNIPLIKGVTFSGGEPLEQSIPLTFLAKKIKEQNLDIWCYTGYTFEEVLNNKDKKELLKYIDVLVDGKFEKKLIDGAKKYTGSRNQRIIDVKESIRKNKVIERKF